MTISVGDTLPDAAFLIMGDNGAEAFELQPRLAGRKVALFGLPGAFTGTCTSAHMPSFIRSRDGFSAKGVDEVLCVTVNDPFVAKAWAEATGADKADITVLADADGAFTKAMGFSFDAPPVGFYGRSQRYSLYAEDGVVKVLNVEVGRGICEISAGETLLAAI